MLWCCVVLRLHRHRHRQHAWDDDSIKNAKFLVDVSRSPFYSLTVDSPSQSFRDASFRCLLRSLFTAGAFNWEQITDLATANEQAHPLFLIPDLANMICEYNNSVDGFELDSWLKSVMRSYAFGSGKKPMKRVSLCGTFHLFDRSRVVMGDMALKRVCCALVRQTIKNVNSTKNGSASMPGVQTPDQTVVQTRFQSLRRLSADAAKAAKRSNWRMRSRRLQRISSCYAHFAVTQSLTRCLFLNSPFLSPLPLASLTVFALRLHPLCCKAVLLTARGCSHLISDV